MATIQEFFEQYEGKFVPYRFEGGFICLSYFICLIGTSSALELIRRQTSNKGIHNLLLLTGAAISMGGVAIWSMQYIGNRAIHILDGQSEFQLAYHTGISLAALFVPIVVLFVAYVIISSHGRVCWVRITLAGILSGAMVVGMHYLADASISNYKTYYHAGNIVGAALIAVFTNIAALAFLFVFESTWTNAWWRRLACAIVLAGALSAVNWCAAAGTRFRLLHLHHRGEGMSTKDSIKGVICLSVAGFVFMIISALYSYWVKKEYAKNAQKVALASAVFDERGRIMVSQEGLLPSEVITDTFIPNSKNDAFDMSNPVFHWMFWASRNWPKITNVLGGMEEHVASLSSAKYARKMKLKLLGDDGEAVENYNMILCELYCLAASSLSSKMKDDLEAAGTLWDEIFATGDVSGPSGRTSPGHGGGSDLPLYRTSTSTTSYTKSNTEFLGEKGAERGDEGCGRGSLMFLVRHVNSRREVEKLEAAGYRFAELHRVLGTIRNGMQIKTPDFAARLRIMSTFSDQDAILRPGLHLGLFAMRARLDYTGFDVLVQRKAKNLLPAIHLQKEFLMPWQSEILNELQGLTTPDIVQRLDISQYGTARERHFARQLLDAITSLRTWTDQPVFDEARLNTSVVQVPCSSVDRTATCSMVTFQLVLPIHLNVSFRNFEAIPLQFFKIRQQFGQEACYTPTGDMKEAAMHFPHSGPSFGPDTGANMSFLELARPGRPFRKSPANRVSRHALVKSLKRLSVVANSHGRDSAPRWKSHAGSGDTQRLATAMGSSGNVAGAGEADNHQTGNIFVSQEVVVDYQQYSDRVDDDVEKAASESNIGMDSRTAQNYRPNLETTAEESYTVTATGRQADAGEDKASFVDELLEGCMEKYKQKKK